MESRTAVRGRPSCGSLFWGGRAQGWVGRHDSRMSQVGALSPDVLCWQRLSCPGLGNNGGCGAGKSRVGLSPYLPCPWWLMSLSALAGHGARKQCPRHFPSVYCRPRPGHVRPSDRLVSTSRCLCEESEAWKGRPCPGLTASVCGRGGEHSRRPLQGCLSGGGGQDI